MKKVLKILGITIGVIYFIGNILPNLIGVPLAAYHSYQAWSDHGKTHPVAQNDAITCTNNECQGTYEGPEFINRSDVAHQFSNDMSRAVGDKLKVLYRNGDYKKVDFSKISMSTEGMGSGHVVYKLSIPFIAVEKPCDAYTSFDHVGGWNHSPALAQRKSQLRNVVMEGHELYISDLKTTPEGLQEYWIQWKNKTTQSACQ